MVPHIIPKRKRIKEGVCQICRKFAVVSMPIGMEKTRNIRADGSGLEIRFFTRKKNSKPNKNPKYTPKHLAHTAMGDPKMWKQRSGS